MTSNNWDMVVDGYSENLNEPYLGEGANFKVVKSTRLIGGKTVAVAVKSLALSLVNGSSSERYDTAKQGLDAMVREILALGELQGSPHVLRSFDFGSWNDPTRGVTLYHVVELSTFGTLSEFLKFEPFTSTEDVAATYIDSQYMETDYATRKSFLIDICRGLYYLHTHNIIHTDLKPANILVFTSSESAGHQAKISDFGSAVLLNYISTESHSLSTRDVQGTDKYCSPEFTEVFAADLRDISATKLRKLDTFAFGVVLVEVLTSSKITKIHVSNGKLIELLIKVNVSRYLPPLDWTQSVKVILERCMQDVTSRCDDMAEILTLLGQHEPNVFNYIDENPPLFKEEKVSDMDHSHLGKFKRWILANELYEKDIIGNLDAKIDVGAFSKVI